MAACTHVGRALVARFHYVVKLEIRGRRRWKPRGRKHQEICDGEGEVGELGGVKTLGDVPGMDFAVPVARKEGRTVVAYLKRVCWGR